MQLLSSGADMPDVKRGLVNPDTVGDRTTNNLTVDPDALQRSSLTKVVQRTSPLRPTWSSR
jgi:hypothetical protein